MAERLEETDLRTMPRRGHARYPWDQWLDGTCWRLEAGTDFSNARELFRRMCHTRARIMGGRAVTRMQGEKHLLVQFVREEPGEP